MKRTASQIFAGLTEAGINDLTERIPLAMISQVTTGGDDSWGPRQEARGAWAVHEPTNGEVPSDFPGQARQASRVLAQIRSDFLAALSIKTSVTSPDTTLERAAASWDYPWGSLATKPVGGAKEYLQEFLSIAVLGWRYPAQTGAAIEVLAGTDYDFAKVLLQSGTPATEAWIYGAVAGCLQKDRALYFPSDEIIVQGIEPPSPWGVLKTLKWVFIGGAILLGAYLIFKTIGAGKQAGVIAG